MGFPVSEAPLSCLRGVHGVSVEYRRGVWGFRGVSVRCLGGGRKLAVGCPWGVLGAPVRRVRGEREGCPWGTNEMFVACRWAHIGQPMD